MKAAVGCLCFSAEILTFIVQKKSLLSIHLRMTKNMQTFCVSLVQFFFSVISVVKPTRCSNVSYLVYFGMTLYMFRTVFLSIASTSRLYLQPQAFVKQILLTAC